MPPHTAPDPSGVTVVIPTYNRADLVVRAVRSVLDQSVSDFELIVVDDGSTDDSVFRLGEIADDRLRVVRQENKGVGAARNHGIREATNGFVVWIDSDDAAEPGWLEFFAQARREGAQVASCAGLLIQNNGDSTLVLPTDEGPAYGSLRACFLAGALGIEREVLLSVGGFREGLRYSEHSDLALRLGGLELHQPLATVVTDRPLVRWYRRDEKVDHRVRYESALALLEHDREHLQRSSSLHSTYYAIAGNAASRLGMKRAALRLTVRAIMVRPARLKNWARLAKVAVARGGVEARR